MSRGDHLFVVRPQLYSHHGIDCGDGTVIHFSGEPGKSKTSARIARATLEEFLDGGHLLVRRYGKRRDPDSTVVAAESRLGDKDYHLVFNNCEHFATWCCTGRSSSEQVRGASTLGAQGAVSATTLGATSSVIATVGVVQGLSGAGIMSALASAGGVVGGTAAAGPAVIGAAPALATIGVVHYALRDDEGLPDDERNARRDARAASLVGAVGATAGGVVAIGAAGTAGLSAVGITTGLATVGTVAGGGMLAGATIIAAAPAVVAAGVATAVYFASRRLRHRT